MMDWYKVANLTERVYKEIRQAFIEYRASQILDVLSLESTTWHYRLKAIDRFRVTVAQATQNRIHKATLA